MNVPVIAQRTFEESRNNPELIAIVNDVLEALQKLPTAKERSEYIHKLVDQYNSEVFSHPLVQQLSPCKMGCSACCHTQVSVTEDEASVLAEKIQGGMEIDQDRLKIQIDTKDNLYFSIPYADRQCVFLDENGACRVYADRPSVCRTNAVLGDAGQCDTSASIRPVRLVKTQKSDMVIYAAFLFSKNNGSLPKIIGKLLEAKAIA